MAFLPVNVSYIFRNLGGHLWISIFRNAAISRLHLGSSRMLWGPSLLYIDHSIALGRALNLTFFSAESLLQSVHSASGLLIGTVSPLKLETLSLLRLDSSRCQWNLDSGFQSLVGFMIP